MTNRLLRPSHRQRIEIALLAVLCLLGQQFAMAAYVCSMSDRAASTMHMDCMQGRAPVGSPLCKQHCAQQPQVAPDAQIRMPIVSLAPVHIVLFTLPAHALHRVAREPPRYFWRPPMVGIAPALRNRVLLI